MNVTVPDDLARRLEQAAQRAREATEQRDELIREAVQAGGSLREVAELVQLSHTGVRKIVQR